MLLLGLFVSLYGNVQGQHSTARQWMETALKVIKIEGRGPTIHARNLFHLSVALYDSWAYFEPDATTYLLGDTLGDFHCAYPQFDFAPEQGDSLREIVMSHAAFSLLFYRFNLFGSKGRTIDVLDSLMISLGRNPNARSRDYTKGSAEALGNYIGQCIIDFGFQDGSNEINEHEIQFYRPWNSPLQPELPGAKPHDPDHWQPIFIRRYLEAKGRDVTLPDWATQVLEHQDEFLSPEWGDVVPFSLTENDMQVRVRGYPYRVYLDPGPPPFVGSDDPDQRQAYRAGFLVNLLWSAHLDPADSVRIDISPTRLGRSIDLPTTSHAYPRFYQTMEGGSKASGHKKNPATKRPYAPNLVLRGDYTRVIAEYWVDAINSVTPPGHWIQTFHQVTDHPATSRKWRGKGKPLDTLEWDVKSYLAIAGAMHDAAISAWSIKAYYDYVRPITAIRWMAGLGQCSDSTRSNFHVLGLPLIPGRIEVVDSTDQLSGGKGEHVGKLKVYSWRGPAYIEDPRKDQAGVGWILAENWWPYQRYSLTTPPFPGYISGHSTFSTAAAEVLTAITGDPFFPGGLLEFTAKKNRFLQFEEGPTEDVTLQWATYRDAADETCLSRIWGGIHPPADDIPGRIIGQRIGEKAMAKACSYFEK